MEKTLSASQRQNTDLNKYNWIIVSDSSNDVLFFKSDAKYNKELEKWYKEFGEPFVTGAHISTVPEGFNSLKDLPYYKTKRFVIIS